jgi:hypothetical protein
LLAEAERPVGAGAFVQFSDNLLPVIKTVLINDTARQRWSRS